LAKENLSRGGFQLIKHVAYKKKIKRPHPRGIASGKGCGYQEGTLVRETFNAPRLPPTGKYTLGKGPGSPVGWAQERIKRRGCAERGGVVCHSTRASEIGSSREGAYGGTEARWSSNQSFGQKRPLRNKKTKTNARKKEKIARNENPSESPVHNALGIALTGGKPSRKGRAGLLKTTQTKSRPRSKES